MGLAGQMVDQRVLMLRELEVLASGERSCLVADPDGYAVLLAERIETLN